MDVYKELKNKYSNIQRNYCLMLKTLKNNNMQFNHIKNDVIELSNIIDLLLLKMEDINMKSIDPEFCSDEEYYLLKQFKENDDIIKTMFPLFIALKLSKNI